VLGVSEFQVNAQRAIRAHGKQKGHQHITINKTSMKLKKNLQYNEKLDYTSLQA
jgi:hypothetical protein